MSWIGVMIQTLLIFFLILLITNQSFSFRFEPINTRDSGLPIGYRFGPNPPTWSLYGNDFYYSCFPYDELEIEDDNEFKNVVAESRKTYRHQCPDLSGSYLYGTQLQSCELFGFKEGQNVGCKPSSQKLENGYFVIEHYRASALRPNQFAKYEELVSNFYNSKDPKICSMCRNNSKTCMMFSAQLPSMECQKAEYIHTLVHRENYNYFEYVQGFYNINCLYFKNGHLEESVFFDKPQFIAQKSEVTGSACGVDTGNHDCGSHDTCCLRKDLWYGYYNGQKPGCRMEWQRQKELIGDNWESSRSHCLPLKSDMQFTSAVTSDELWEGEEVICKLNSNYEARHVCAMKNGDFLLNQCVDMATSHSYYLFQTSEYTSLVEIEIFRDRGCVPSSKYGKDPNFPIPECNGGSLPCQRISTESKIRLLGGNNILSYRISSSLKCACGAHEKSEFETLGLLSCSYCNHDQYQVTEDTDMNTFVKKARCADCTVNHISTRLPSGGTEGSCHVATITAGACCRCTTTNAEFVAVSAREYDDDNGVVYEECKFVTTTEEFNNPDIHTGACCKCTFKYYVSNVNIDQQHTCDPIPVVHLKYDATIVQKIDHYKYTDPISNRIGVKMLGDGKFYLNISNYKSVECTAAKNPFQYRHLCGGLLTSNQNGVSMYIEKQSEFKIWDSDVLETFSVTANGTILQSTGDSSTNLEEWNLVRPGKIRDCLHCANGEYNSECSSENGGNHGTCRNCLTKDDLTSENQWLRHINMIHVSNLTRLPGCDQWSIQKKITTNYEIEPCVESYSKKIDNKENYFLCVGCGRSISGFNWWVGSRNLDSARTDRPVLAKQRCIPDEVNSRQYQDIEACRWKQKRITPTLDVYEKCSTEFASIPYCPRGWYVDKKAWDNLAPNKPWDENVCKKCTDCTVLQKRGINYQTCSGSTDVDSQNLNCIDNCELGQFEGDGGMCQICNTCSEGFI